MTGLDDRLRALGDALDLPDDVTIELDSLDELQRRDQARRTVVLRAAVIVVVVAVGLTLTVPSSRRTVADWFGLDGVDLERDPRVEAPDQPDPFGDTPGTVLDVDGTAVLFSEFDGSLAPEGLRKTLGDGSDVVEVTVGDAPGVWVDGAPHEVSYRDPSGELLFERFAGNTLLWQRGNRIARVEGFDDVDAAIAFALTR